MAAILGVSPTEIDVASLQAANASRVAQSVSNGVMIAAAGLFLSAACVDCISNWAFF